MNLVRLQQLLPRPILSVLAKLYSLGVQGRLILYRTGYLTPRRLKATTISVGNISVGGAGKTPLVEYLAKYFTEQSYAVSILTRGYGRKHPGRRQVVSNGQEILNDVGLAGDEPLLLAHHLPGVVIIADADRHAAGQWSEETFDIDIHILDDAFQYLELERDINLLLLDALDPFAGQQPLPLGRLREPISEIARADAIIITGADRHFDQAALEATLEGVAGRKPIFYAYREMTGLRNPMTTDHKPPQYLIDQPIGMFCAIGRPDRFLEDLRHFRANIVYHQAFPDHHRYAQHEIERVFAAAHLAGAEGVVTTEKDWMRLTPLCLPATPPLWVVQSELRVADHTRLLSYLIRQLEKEGPNSPLPPHRR